MKIPKYITFPLIFIISAGVFAFIQYYILGVPYATKKEAPIALVAEVFLCLLILYYVKKFASWKELGFGKFSLKSFLWILPLLLLNIASSIVLFTSVAQASPDKSIIFGIGITLFETFLIGFAEETMFRGVLLRGLLMKHNVLLSIIVSSVGFSLLHSINIFAGYPFQSMINQLGATFMYGLLMAPLALLVKNMWPLIISHFLWDFVSLAKSQLPPTIQLSGSYAMFLLMIQFMQVVLLIVVWFVIFVRWKNGTLSKLINLQ